jgi:hypothetical protein
VASQYQHRVLLVRLATQPVSRALLTVYLARLATFAALPVLSLHLKHVQRVTTALVALQLQHPYVPLAISAQLVQRPLHLVLPVHYKRPMGAARAALAPLVLTALLVAAPESHVPRGIIVLPEHHLPINTHARLARTIGKVVALRPLLASLVLQGSSVTQRVLSSPAGLARLGTFAQEAHTLLLLCHGTL